jgi:hypothetical protein
MKDDKIKCETIPLQSLENIKENGVLFGSEFKLIAPKIESDLEHRIHILENAILDLQSTVMSHGEMINSIFSVLQRNNTTLLL